jgi:tetratricopeptide (TPR) repeat protein
MANLPIVTSRTFLAYCLAEQGAFDAAAAGGAEGMQVAEAAEHANSLVIACLGIGRLALNRGDLPQAITVLEHGLRLCQSAHIALLFSATAAGLGCAYALAGRMTEALALFEQLQPTALLPSPLSALVVVWLAETALHTGRLASAQTLAERALKLAQDRQERGNHAWALRLLGRLATHGDVAHMTPVAASPYPSLHCHRALPCHADGLLAAPGRGGTGTGAPRYWPDYLPLSRLCRGDGCHMSMPLHLLLGDLVW